MLDLDHDSDSQHMCWRCPGGLCMATVMSHPLSPTLSPSVIHSTLIQPGKSVAWLKGKKLLMGNSRGSSCSDFTKTQLHVWLGNPQRQMEIRLSNLRVFCSLFQLLEAAIWSEECPRFSPRGHVKHDVTEKAAVTGNWCDFVVHSLSDMKDTRSRKGLCFICVRQLIFWLVYA